MKPTKHDMGTFITDRQRDNKTRDALLHVNDGTKSIAKSSSLHTLGQQLSQVACLQSANLETLGVLEGILVSAAAQLFDDNTPSSAQLTHGKDQPSPAGILAMLDAGIGNLQELEHSLGIRLRDVTSQLYLLFTSLGVSLPPMSGGKTAER